VDILGEPDLLNQPLYEALFHDVDAELQVGVVSGRPVPAAALR
jgi:hypothetical protein